MKVTRFTVTLTDEELVLLKDILWHAQTLPDVEKRQAALVELRKKLLTPSDDWRIA